MRSAPPDLDGPLLILQLSLQASLQIPVISTDQRERRNPLMQRVMQMFVARFASRNLSIYRFIQRPCRSRFEQYRPPQRNAEEDPDWTLILAGLGRWPLILLRFQEVSTFARPLRARRLNPNVTYFSTGTTVVFKPPKYLSFRPTNGSGETSAFRECLHHPKSQMGQFGPYWLLLYGK